MLSDLMKILFVYLPMISFSAYTYILNVYTVFIFFQHNQHLVSDNFTLFYILRIVGIFVIPIGCLFGFGDFIYNLQVTFGF
jgi:hypothetical protein